MIIKIDTNGNPVGYPLLDANLRMLFPDLPAILTNAVLLPYEYALYTPTARPTATGRYKVVYDTTPVADGNGGFLQAHAERDMTSEEGIALDVAKATSVTNQVKETLRRTDTYLLPEYGATFANRQTMVIYRKQLVDLLSAPEFPWSTVIPGIPVINPYSTTIPYEVGPGQLRVALKRLHGITNAQLMGALSVIADAGARDEAETLLEYATTIRRDHPLISVFGAYFTLTSAQIDTVYTTAAGI